MLDDKAIVNAEDALQSIRSGMSNEALMAKYAISEKGLESLFRKLIEAGKIEETELEWRRRSLRRQSWVYSLGSHLRRRNIEKTDPEPQAPAPADRSIWQEHKQYFSAAAGALVGGAVVFVSMTAFDRWDSVKSRHEPGSLAPLIAAIDRDLAEAEHLIKILQAIARDPTGKGYSKALSTASEYQRCLENCTKNFHTAGESDKALLVNCRKECISLYSERVKEIRKRFYGDAELE